MRYVTAVLSVMLVGCATHAPTTSVAAGQMWGYTLTRGDQTLIMYHPHRAECEARRKIQLARPGDSLGVCRQIFVSVGNGTYYWATTHAVSLVTAVRTTRSGCEAERRTQVNSYKQPESQISTCQRINVQWQ